MTEIRVRRADFMMVLAYATDLATGQSRDFALEHPDGGSPARTATPPPEIRRARRPQCRDRIDTRPPGEYPVSCGSESGAIRASRIARAPSAARWPWACGARMDSPRGVMAYPADLSHGLPVEACGGLAPV